MSFCGTIHSDRPSWIKSLIQYREKQNFKLGLMLFYYSPFLSYVRLAINSCSFTLARRISYEPFHKHDIANLFRKSRVVIDLTHPKQKGFTSRTFEALRSGAKLATNNKNIKILMDDFPDRIFLFDRAELKKSGFQRFIFSDVDPLSSEQDRFLSVERFVDQILDTIND